VHTLVLGGAIHGSGIPVRSPPILQSPANDALLSLGYGGVRVGAIVRSSERVHLTLGMLVGTGGASSATTDSTFRRSADIFVIEPDVAIQINAFPHVRFAITGAYRYADPMGGPSGFTVSRLSGPSLGISLRVGEF
jgi:hypothetical protein